MVSMRAALILTVVLSLLGTPGTPHVQAEANLLNPKLSGMWQSTQQQQITISPNNDWVAFLMQTASGAQLFSATLNGAVGPIRLSQLDFDAATTTQEVNAAFARGRR